MVGFGTMSMGFNIASSILEGVHESATIRAQNRQNKKSFKEATQRLREQIALGKYRTDATLHDINRNKVRQKMTARKAGVKARGQVATSAAQLGIAGNRGVKRLFANVTKEEADMVTDAELDAATSTYNTINQFNDNAQRAINGLNAQSPLEIAEPSIISKLTSVAADGLNSYSHLSDAQKSDFKQDFSGFVNLASKSLGI